MQGIGAGFDGALFVGYHARAGTAAAVLEHTWNYKVFSARFGELEVGEFGLGALLAGHFGVPPLYVSGDDKTAAEAGRCCPASSRRSSRRASSRLGAELCPPQEARARMRADVESAVRRSAEAKPLAWNGSPLTLTFTRVEFCDRAARLPGRAAPRRAHAGDRRRRPTRRST